MDKMKMESPDMTAQNIDRIAALRSSLRLNQVSWKKSNPRKHWNLELPL